MAKELWEIKYRPKTIHEYLFQNEKQKQVLLKFIEEQSIPHLLFNGHRGTGKTTLAYIIKNELDIQDADFMFINASDENDVNTMRNKIKGFISTFSMSQFKLIVLDEADYLTHNAQAILRSMMEEYSDNARFILCCNRGAKIIPELKSRCLEFKYSKMEKQDMLERLAIILKAEKIKTKLDILEEYVDLAYPDMRKAIQLIQNNSVDGQLVKPAGVDPSTEVHIRIVELMEKEKYASIRDVISTGMGDDDWEELYIFLYNYLHEIGKFTDEKKWKAGIIILAEHLYKHALVADPEINGMAMFLRLGEI
jgi:DNA polymerase III delta prime subunit